MHAETWLLFILVLAIVLVWLPHDLIEDQKAKTILNRWIEVIQGEGQ